MVRFRKVKNNGNTNIREKVPRIGDFYDWIKYYNKSDTHNTNLYDEYIDWWNKNLDNFIIPNIKYLTYEEWIIENKCDPEKWWYTEYGEWIKKNWYNLIFPKKNNR